MNGALVSGTDRTRVRSSSKHEGDFKYETVNHCDLSDEPFAATASAQFNYDYLFGVANEIEGFSSQVSIALDDGSFLTVDTEHTTSGDLNAILLRVASDGSVL